MGDVSGPQRRNRPPRLALLFLSCFLAGALQPLRALGALPRECCGYATVYCPPSDVSAVVELTATQALDPFSDEWVVSAVHGRSRPGAEGSLEDLVVKTQNLSIAVGDTVQQEEIGLAPHVAYDLRYSLDPHPDLDGLLPQRRVAFYWERGKGNWRLLQWFAWLDGKRRLYFGLRTYCQNDFGYPDFDAALPYLFSPSSCHPELKKDQYGCMDEMNAAAEAGCSARPGPRSAPASLAILGLACLGLLAARRRRTGPLAPRRTP